MGRISRCKDTGAETVIQVLFEYVFSRHGFPDGFTLLTDNAQSFRSVLLKAFTQTFGIRHTFTTLHHPKTNVRVNCVSISNALRSLCSQQQDT